LKGSSACWIFKRVVLLVYEKETADKGHQSLLQRVASFPGSSPAFCCILYKKRPVLYSMRQKAGEEPGNEASKGCVFGLGGLQAFLEGYSTLET